MYICVHFPVPSCPQHCALWTFLDTHRCMPLCFLDCLLRALLSLALCLPVRAIVPSGTFYSALLGYSCSFQFARVSLWCAGGHGTVHTGIFHGARPLFMGLCSHVSCPIHSSLGQWPLESLFLCTLLYVLCALVGVSPCPRVHCLGLSCSSLWALISFLCALLSVALCALVVP